MGGTQDPVGQSLWGKEAQIPGISEILQAMLRARQICKMVLFLMGFLIHTCHAIGAFY